MERRNRVIFLCDIDQEHNKGTIITNRGEGNFILNFSMVAKHIEDAKDLIETIEGKELKIQHHVFAFMDRTYQVTVI